MYVFQIQLLLWQCHLYIQLSHTEGFEFLCCITTPGLRKDIRCHSEGSNNLAKPYGLTYTPSQRGNYITIVCSITPTAAVNLFLVGKQYLTFCQAEAAVTHSLIGRKIISSVKRSDTRSSLPILDVIRSSHKRHSASEYCKWRLRQTTGIPYTCWSAISLSDGI